MIRKRLVAVVIVVDGKVVQSESFNHTNIIHSDAYHAVEAFSSWDVDEIVLLNASRKQSSKFNFLDVVSTVSKVCWVPLSVGGHITSEEYGRELLLNGADKLVINSAFWFNPEVPKLLSRRLGRQSIVASIDVKTDPETARKFVWVDRGSLDTGRTLSDWIVHTECSGAGELLINNIDFDGNRQGYDLECIDVATSICDLPVIIFGGASENKHFAEGLQRGASAVAAANMFHYKEMATKYVKKYLKLNDFNVRFQ